MTDDDPVIVVRGDLDVAIVIKAVDQMSFDGPRSERAAAANLLERWGCIMGSDGIYRRRKEVTDE